MKTPDERAAVWPEAVEIMRTAMTAAASDALDRMAAIDLPADERTEAILYGSLAALCDVWAATFAPAAHEAIPGVVAEVLPAVLEASILALSPTALAGGFH